jgi:hypothetical protein
MRFRVWFPNVILALAVAAFVIPFPVAARAQEIGDFGFGHEQYHDWYNTGENGGPLLRPYGTPGIKCCDGDCRPTKARLKEDGSWEVWVERRWLPVPPERIKTNVSNPSTLAHVCASKDYGISPPAIFCFVPPEIES